MCKLMGYWCRLLKSVKTEGVVMLKICVSVAKINGLSCAARIDSHRLKRITGAVGYAG